MSAETALPTFVPMMCDCPRHTLHATTAERLLGVNGIVAQPSLDLYVTLYVLLILPRNNIALKSDWRDTIWETCKIWHGWSRDSTSFQLSGHHWHIHSCLRSFQLTQHHVVGWRWPSTLRLCSLIHFDNMTYGSNCSVCVWYRLCKVDLRWGSGTSPAGCIWNTRQDACAVPKSLIWNR